MPAARRLLSLAMMCATVAAAAKPVTKEQVVEELVEDVKKTITTIFSPMVQFSFAVLLVTLLCIQFDVGRDPTRLGSRPSLKDE